MTVKKGENDKLIAKLQRKLEAREKEIAKLKAGRKADKKQIKNLQRENNKKKDKTVILTRNQSRLLSELLGDSSSGNS
jgi:cell division protein FtsB